jgi:Tfp pilus assembly protein PilO
MQTTEADRNLKFLRWVINGAGCLVLFAGLAVAQFAFFAALDAQTDACADRARHLKQLLTRSAEVRAEHHRLTLLNHEADARARAILQRIPDEPQEAEFLSQVTQLAQQVSLQIIDYRPAAALESDTCWHLEVQLACRGTYASLCRFLDGLNHLERFTNLARLDVASDGQSTEYAVSMSLVLYFGLKRSMAPPQEATVHG